MKTKYLKVVLLFTTILAVFIGCDNIDPPYTIETSKADTNKFPVPDFPTNYKVVKKVLLEDFTGHKCGNCPRAAEELVRLEDKFQDQLVPVSLSVSDYFAGADETGYFTNDYRTETGNELNTYFGIESAGLPKGLINRAAYELVTVLNHGSWEAGINEQLNGDPKVDIQIITQFNAESDEYAAHVQTELLVDFDYRLYLSVFLLEDSVISAQKDYKLDPSVIEDYAHRHMLRGSLNGTWGTSIFEGSANKGDKFVNSYSSVFNSAYYKYNCYIVAFVYNDETKEVLQAEEVKILSRE